MGLNYYDKFLVDGGSKDPEVLWEALIRQARHITDVGGMEILGLGSDFDGIPTNPALPGAEAMPVLWDRLKNSRLYGKPAGWDFLGKCDAGISGCFVNCT